MKKALFVIGLFLSVFVTAQELRTVSFDRDQLNKTEIKLSATWNSDIVNKSLSIYNGNISNRSNGSTGGLRLEYYLAPGKVNLSENQLTGYFIAQTPINNINRNTSAIGVSIRNTVTNLPPDGNYYPVLVLTNSNGRILDIFQMDGIIEIRNNSMHQSNIVQAEPIEDKIESVPVPVKTEEKRTATNMSAVTDINKPVKLNVRIDKNIVFEKDWKLEIDYKEFMVSLAGGDIANNTNANTGKLIVDVYFTKDRQADFSSNFNGILVASAPVDPVGGQMKLSSVSIRTNLRAVPPQGVYYMVMTLSEVEDSGKTVLKSFRPFKNPVTL